MARKALEMFATMGEKITTWTVVRIAEADYGCEERMPGEPLMALVTLEADDGRECCFEIADDWLVMQDINEGDEWPEDIDNDADGDALIERAEKQNDFMNNYYDALEELEDY